MGFRSDLFADSAAHYSPDSPMRGRPWRALAWALLSSPGMRLALLYRLGAAARPVAGPVGLMISKLCFWHGGHFYKCSIASTAQIGGGLILPHPQGIVIGAGVVIGPRAWLFQNVTIGGGSPKRPGVPTIGSDARIYAGAVVAGPATLGDQVAVGANAVVSFDVPDESYVGAPRYFPEQEMKEANL